VKKTKKYTAIFLLAIFGFAMLPTSLLHEFFADHTDAADNHCHFYHKDLGRHVEEKETHCDAFKANTPLYDALKIEHDFSLSVTFVSEYKASAVSAYSFSTPLHLPARAPPVA